MENTVKSWKLGHRRSASRVALGAAFAAALSWAAPAQADTVQADALFEEGQTLFDAGDYPQACAKFEASLQFVHRLGTLLNLARCHKFEGKTATAYAEFKEAEALARKAGENDRAEAAANFAKELEGSLSRLTISVESPPEGLVVKRDGAEVAAASYGVAIPTDPGEHTIQASAPGMLPFETKITIGATNDAQTVTIPPLEEDPNAGAVIPGPDGGGEGAATDSDPGATMRTAGFIVGGVGIAGIGLGAVMGLVASSTASGAEEDPTLCPGKQCTPAGREEIDSAETTALVSTIGFGVGAAALAAGVVLIVLSGSQDAEDQGAAASSGGGYSGGLTLLPSLGPSEGGLTVRGSF
jgi:hypothetical protein